MEPELEARAPWLRSGLILLAAAGMVVGVWALLAPESLYDDFPGGRSWVSAFPPYNEHLVRDVGGLNLALAILLGFAAIVLERRLIQAVSVAALVYAVPHFAFHVAHLEEWSTGDQVAGTVALALAIAIPLVLLILATMRRRA